ncbi:hypothetical protein [Bosea minatitlanensis]|uniref:Uncharacterized protein n=1 Tax=Bosea minatitlanensis TaxID=128782 RepID=A0ABW0F2A9_9HYPH|nr:hypothetical protein [Bosea minatitlanensis]MCT4492698.1 hypothetical protein [Bosea minatitlanensis]
MPAGLTLYNSWGTVQIDQNWRNYGFRQKIPVTITSYYTSPPNPAGFPGTTYQLVVAGTPALLVACKASTLQPIRMHSYYADGIWTFNWCFVIPFTDAVTETVEFFVFDTMNGSYSNVGLEVFNQAGERVFHSDAPVMKVAPGQPCDVDFTGTPGKNYVPLITRNPIFGYLAGFPAGYRIGAHTLRVSGSNIVTSTVGFASWGASGEYANGGAFIPVDVTGLS